MTAVLVPQTVAKLVAPKAPILVEVASGAAWITRQLIVRDTISSACTSCQQPILRGIGPEGRSVRIEPAPRADGVYVTHRGHCSVEIHYSRRAP